MALLFAPKSAQQLRTAVDMLGLDLGLGRGSRNAILTLLVQRSRVLDFMCDAAVRLSTLMAACEKDGYITFLYLRLKAGRQSPITESKFKQAFTVLWKARGLGGSFDLEPDCIVFRATQHSFKGAPYRLNFSFMPAACAMLGLFVNNATAGEKARMFRRGSQIPRDDLTSDELAAELRTWVHAWLNDKTLSEHRIKQASAFHGFLSGFRSASATFYDDNGVSLAQIDFPSSIAAAEQARANAEGAKPITPRALVHGTGSEGATRKHGQFGAADNENMQQSLRTADHGVRDENASRFDGWVCEPSAITDWHRAVWPAAAKQFDQGNRPSTGTSHFNRESLNNDIGDDLILFFWSEITRDQTQSSQLGFRKFRTAARAMIDYKKALRLADDAYNPDFAQSMVRFDGSELEYEETVGVVSTSPLQELLRLDSVKWLQNTRLQPLFSIMDGASRKSEKLPDGGTLHHADDAGWQEDTTDDEGQSLFGHSLPDRGFSRTLLRYHCFGDLQELAIRKSALFAASYDEFAGKIVEIATSFEEVALATSYCLIQTGDLAGLNLLEAIRPGAIEEFGLSGVVKGSVVDLEDLADRAREQISKGDSPIGRQLHSAYSGINRVGFRKKPSDMEDPSVLDALERGAQPISDLLYTVSRVRGWYAVKNGADEYVPRSELIEAFEADHDVFERILKRMYPTGASTESVD